jgi:glutathione S-transferase
VYADYIAYVAHPIQIPVMTYGGPEVPPDQPSPESTKLTESNILCEFIADLYPDSHLFPSSPVDRAKARFFIDLVTNTFAPSFRNFVRGSTPLEPIYDAVLQVQDHIAGTYALGERFTIADVCVAPFIARMEIALGNDIGLYEPGLGKGVWEKISEEPRYEKFRTYWANLRQRESFRKTFNEVRLLIAHLWPSLIICMKRNKCLKICRPSS